MTLQAVRASIEVPLIEAFTLQANPVPVFVENEYYEHMDSRDEFALIRLQWGLMSEPSIGCRPGELLRGVVVIELFTQKGTGPGRAQEVITPILQVLSSYGGLNPAEPRFTVGSISGPMFTALDGRPHLLTRVSAPIRARG